MKGRLSTVVAIYLIGISASAQTIVPAGNVTGTWDLAGSPYLIQGEITVPGEVGDPNPLTIEAGVEVIFQGHYKMIVNGILEAEGTQSDPILFTTADTSAGWHGIRFIDAPYPSYLSFCILEHGRATGSGANENGGAIYCLNSNPVISHCTFANNYAEDYGAGIYCEDASPTINKCTLSQNLADDGGSGIYCTSTSCSTIVINCILWDNVGSQLQGDLQVTYSDIQYGWPGEGNIDANPMFIDTAGGDYGLQWGSPCIDTGNPDPVYKDPDGTRADMGAYYYPHSLQVSSILLYYGLVIIGSPEDLPLTVTNMLDSTMILYGFTTGDPSFYTDFNLADSLLLPGDSLIVTVTFDPPLTGIYEDTLTILNNFLDCQVGLLGTGLEGGTPIEGGAVSGTWQASGSPYWINGDIAVPAGEILNIEPGVEVCFLGYHQFVVNGFLEALGTETDSILFIALDLDEGWHGIRFIDALGSSHLSYCVIQYGRALGSHPHDYGGGIYCERSNPVISHCTIRDNQAYLGGGIAIRDSANPAVLNCRVTGNSSSYRGGGIDIDGANPILENCTIDGNYSDFRGGGISCLQATPIISNCTIYGNSSANRGGGINISEASPTIDHCTIQGNSSALMGGGGIASWFASPSILNCTITANWAGHGDGGGIKCMFDDPHIENCFISSNSATYDGGGAYFDESSLTILECTISDNSAGDDGGGIRCLYTADANLLRCNVAGNSANRGAGMALTGYSPTIHACTVTQNSALSHAGGLYCDDSSPNVKNCILWNDDPEEIYLEGSSSPQVTYSDVMGSYTDLGNIEEDPLFVFPEQSDHRLKWNSPCIDSGDPNPAYNNPDGTVADMGAFYYDQSVPARILLTPHNAPIQIPAEGGSFDYTIWVTNIDPSMPAIDIWCDVTLPNGTIFGPVLGPISTTLDSGITVNRERSQVVPAGAPEGIYLYHAYAVAGVDSSIDSFTFQKRGSNGSDWISGWFNAGESFAELPSSLVGALHPRVYSLEQNYPNPFNPVTTISYGLPEASHVSLAIYDITGRMVTTLVDGRREAGRHGVTLDGSGLASGVYIYRIEAGDFTASGKMVLMK